MKRVSRSSFMVMALLVVANAFAPMEVAGDGAPGGEMDHPGCIVGDLADYTVLDVNSSANHSAELRSDIEPPFYDNEPVNLVVVWWVEPPTKEPNGTVKLKVGMDALTEPECIFNISVNLTDGDDDGPEAHLFGASINVTPNSGSQAFVGRVIYRNETLNLTYELDVRPARILLAASIDLPNGTWSGPELEWASVPVLLRNEGGLPAAELVVDFRYAGRIVSTFNVSLVAPQASFPIGVLLFPLFNEELMEVHLVEGPDAPYRIGDLPLEVGPRPILDVVLLRAEPTELENGDRVFIEALVRNRGNATSDGQLVELMVDGTVVGNQSIEGLEPGSEVAVSTNWTMRGEGVHTISALAEGDDFAALPVAVEVKAETPTAGTMMTILALVGVATVSWVARRS